MEIPIRPARPGLFTANGTGKRPAAALNENGSVSTPNKPAKRGEVVWRAGERESPEGVTVAQRE